MQQDLSLMSNRKILYLVLLITTLTTLPWIGAGDYYTKGEPREASVAVSMINEGNWILPRIYADEIPYKPPLTHWLIAVCSLPGGEVTPFTSRLPSVIAFIIMIGCCFTFFSKFLNRDKSLIAILILISCFELHRSAMTSRVDMLLTMFMVCGMISLLYWMEYKQLKGLPWYIPLLLGCAALAKGPVGVILPVFIFGLYLLVIRQKLIVIILKCFLVTVLSLIPLLIWYYLAYLQAGESFLELAWSENFGRFLRSDNSDFYYKLGHTHPFWYNFILLFLGFMPVTLFLFFSLFAIKYRFRIPKNIWHNTLAMDRGKLFSLIAACIIIIFYCIPASKRGVYLMPAYPFIAVFLSQYIYSITMNFPRVNRVFAGFLGSVIGIVILLSIFSLSGWLDLQGLVSNFTDKDKALHQVTLIQNALSTPTIVYIILFICLLFAFYTHITQFRKKNQKVLLYATFGLWLTCNMMLDGVVLPTFKNGRSIKPFVNEIINKYPLKEGNMYVMNDVNQYRNLYGTNFYLHNQFLNFAKEQPQEGFFFATSTDILKIKDIYKEYEFKLLEQTPDRFNDSNAVIQLYEFRKIE